MADKTLVIVESPAKAKTIKGILGSRYDVRATMGHIRDLPQKTFGIDIEKDFEPKYTIIPDKKKVAAELKKIADKYKTIYMATDEDREGEAIAWHTAYAIKRNPEEIMRVAFHEIVPEAVKNAFKSPRNIYMDLVDAQQARRILDRVVGYTLSPILGKNLERGLSAGRVQSVALRLIVEREQEIDKFTPVIYWTIKALIEGSQGGKISLSLKKEGTKKIDKESLTDKQRAADILSRLEDGDLTVSEISETDKRSKPPPPFITSTLQQEASIRLGFSSSKTMYLAQQLYEGIEISGESTGLITYMRTDSPTTSKSSKDEARHHIETFFGAAFLPAKPRYYKSRSASAQEAHEAIRPTSVKMVPESLKNALTGDQYKLYNFIWNRFIASQMEDAKIKNTKLSAINGKYTFEGENNTIIFPGFMKLWEVKTDTGEEGLGGFKAGDKLSPCRYLMDEHTTRPPARYTEASLIKVLEKNGIGRPSTYAPTISTLINRGYIKREKRTLFPLKIGIAVNTLLMKFFSEIIKIGFTANMEKELDKIAKGEKKHVELLNEFYKKYKPMLDLAKEEIPGNNKDIEDLLVQDRRCTECDIKLIIKRGKYGMFLACPNYPECKYTEEVKKDPHTDSVAAEKVAQEDKKCPNCESQLVLKHSRYGPFLACPKYPECKYTERMKKNANYTRNRPKKK